MTKNSLYPIKTSTISMGIFADDDDVHLGSFAWLTMKKIALTLSQIPPFQQLLGLHCMVKAPFTCTCTV